jgi:hypothetical protein
MRGVPRSLQNIQIGEKGNPNGSRGFEEAFVALPKCEVDVSGAPRRIHRSCS